MLSLMDSFVTQSGQFFQNLLFGTPTLLSKIHQEQEKVGPVDNRHSPDT